MGDTWGIKREGGVFIRFGNWWQRLRWRVRGYIPFTNWWLVERKLDKEAKTILDLGCGVGCSMQFLNRRGRFKTVGIDGFKPYVDRCRRERSYDEVKLGDIRVLEYGNDAFDVVMCLQTLEHLDRGDGKKLIEDMGRIAKKQVIVTTDIHEYVYSGVDGNPLQRHRYVWSDGELKAVGFDVHGFGLRGWGGETGFARFLPQPFRWLLTVFFQVGLGGIMYHHPEWAESALCVRNNNGGE